MVNTWNYTFVKTHSATPRVSPNINDELWVILAQCGLTDGKQMFLLWLGCRQASCACVEKGCIGALYFPLNSTANIKLL